MRNSLLKTSILATILVGGFSASAIYALNTQQTDNEYMAVAPISDNGFSGGIDAIGLGSGEGAIIGSGNDFYTMGYTTLVYDEESYTDSQKSLEPRKYDASEYFGENIERFTDVDRSNTGDIVATVDKDGTEHIYTYGDGANNGALGTFTEDELIESGYYEMDAYTAERGILTGTPREVIIPGMQDNWTVKFVEAAGESMYAVINDGVSDRVFAWGSDPIAASSVTAYPVKDTATWTPVEVIFNDSTLGIDTTQNWTVDFLDSSSGAVNENKYVMVAETDTEKHLFTWGSNGYGALAGGDTVAVGGGGFVDHDITTLDEEIKLVDISDTNLMVVTEDSDGTDKLYQSGRNTTSAIDSTSTTEVNELTLTYELEDGIEIEYAINNDQETFYAVTEENGVQTFWGWGSNDKSALSSGASLSIGEESPIKIGFDLSDGQSITGIYSSSSALAPLDQLVTFVIVEDGGEDFIYGLGTNARGVLCTGDFQPRLSFTLMQKNIDSEVVLKWLWILLIVILLISLVFGLITLFVHYEHKKGKEIHWFHHGHLIEITDAHLEEVESTSDEENAEEKVE